MLQQFRLIHLPGVSRWLAKCYPGIIGVAKGYPGIIDIVKGYPGIMGIAKVLPSTIGVVKNNNNNNNVYRCSRTAHHTSPTLPGRLIHPTSTTSPPF